MEQPSLHISGAYVNGEGASWIFGIYGHPCPSLAMGMNKKELVCNGFWCRFWKEDHPLGIVMKHPRKDRWGGSISVIRRAWEVPELRTNHKS
jgi:hypothetical protein